MHLLQDESTRKGMQKQQLDSLQVQLNTSQGTNLTWQHCKLGEAVSKWPPSRWKASGLPLWRPAKNGKWLRNLDFMQGCKSSRICLGSAGLTKPHQFHSWPSELLQALLQVSFSLSLFIISYKIMMGSMVVCHLAERFILSCVDK